MSRRERTGPAKPAARPLGVGDWIWACRPGFEADLVEELERADKKSLPSRVAVGLVKSSRRPRRGSDFIELAFARQGLPVDALLAVAGDDPRVLGEAVAGAIGPLLGAGAAPFALQVWVADSDEANPLASYATAMEEAAVAALGPKAMERRVLARATRSGDDRFVQVCVLAASRAAVGVIPIGGAVSLAPGGRRRIGAPAGAPSRAASKLLEAFDWLGRGPDPGDRCIDLGAAPGGWTHVLLERRARVIAIDPARMAPSLAKHKNLQHVQASAFTYQVEEPVDWLFCDMAWRPLEVAALLAKWGRRGAARFLIANIKLPMKQKVEFVRRVSEIIATGGWQNLRVRQLYHDREEVTLGAWRI
ncbi:MAG: 23S rRNA (cytidine(2498)-2'-O)-methyltransferase RlmM [Myxococcales bacterium]|nr:23S rRNA (cytidine(2498)-2'-O)-methyltransferase RlmM [Myxococcales bacterium]